MSTAARSHLTLDEAITALAEAKANLPPAGREFYGPEDARHFTAYCRAMLELERAALQQAAQPTRLSA